MLYPHHAHGNGKWSSLGTSHKEQRTDSVEGRILHLQQSRSLDVVVLDLGCLITENFLEQFTKFLRLAKLPMRQMYASIRSYQARWTFRTLLTLSAFAVDVNGSRYDGSIKSRTCKGTHGGRSRACSNFGCSTLLICSRCSLSFPAEAQPLLCNFKEYSA